LEARASNAIKETVRRNASQRQMDVASAANRPTERQAWSGIGLALLVRSAREHRRPLVRFIRTQRARNGDFATSGCCG